MKKYFVIAGILVLFILSLSACIAEEPISTEPAFTPMLTSLPTFTLSPVPTNTSTLVPTEEPIKRHPTASPTPDPGLIITLAGQDTSYPWGGKAVFSFDGELIVLATSRIRFWDTETFKLVHEFEYPRSEDCRTYDSAISEDGRYFAASSSQLCNAEVEEFLPLANIFVWDLVEGKIIHIWEQKFAMSPGFDEEVVTPLSELVFLPKSSRLAYASGNTIVIRDVATEESLPDILDLGEEMYAMELSVREDGQYLYALKTDYYDRFTNNELQVWHMDPIYLDLDKEYTDINPNGLIMSLQGDNVLFKYFEKGLIKIQNLTSNTMQEIVYEEDWIYFNLDFSYIITVKSGYQFRKTFKLWDGNMQEELYSFSPTFGEEWAMAPILFSPDHTVLAIIYDEYISLWNINSIVNPEREP